MKTESRFVERYLRKSAQAITSLDEERILSMGARLLQAYAEEKRVFVIGNGGSAALASHLACDLSKTVCGAKPRDKRKRLKAICLSDNVSVFTAWANDEGYEHVFSEQLKNLAGEGDVLVAISSSGNSPNIINAIETARDMRLHTMAIVGFDGGQASTLAHEHLQVDSFDYGVVESTHDVLCHLLTAWVSAQVAELDRRQDVVQVLEQVALVG